MVIKMISYTPLWETMKAKNITTYKLITKHNISKNTIHRLKHNCGISTTLLNDLCSILDCKVEDVLLYIPDEQ